MINFINNELYSAHKIINQNMDVIKTIENLETIKNDIFKHHDNSCETELYKKMINVKLNDQIYSFILFLIELYSSIPQLETETSYKYPIIKKQYISEKYIYEFSNRILKEENFSKPFNFNGKSLIIFKNQSRFKRNDSRCIVYSRYYTNDIMILLNRYNNIRDLVQPLKKFIEIINYYENISFTNETEIIEYYIYHKAINKLIVHGNKEANKLYMTSIDNMVYNARLLNNKIKDKDWKHLPAKIIFKLLDFTNHAIALELNSNNEIALNDLFSLSQNNNTDKYPDINLLPIKRNNVENHIDNHINKLLKKQYY